MIENLKSECPNCKSKRTGVKDRSGKTTIRMKCRDCDKTWSVPKNGIPFSKEELSTLNDGISGTILREKFDVTAKIERALKSLPYKPEGVFFTKSQVLQRAGIPQSRTGMTEVLNSFEDYCGTTVEGRKTYYGHPHCIQEWRDKNLFM